MADFKFEQDLFKRGLRFIAGVDEVGRGALFGPVVAAAVILPERLILDSRAGWTKEINDSKLLSPANRQRLARRIWEEAASVGIGYASNVEVDQKNIYWASFAAMKRAVENMALTPDILLVDGFALKGVDYAQMGIPQGDRKSTSIAAASIVAKVFRDEMMVSLDQVYHGYHLGKNKGYGTREHYQALDELGPTSLHRLTFNLKLRTLGK
jgi:ribonuclease HII